MSLIAPAQQQDGSTLRRREESTMESTVFKAILAVAFCVFSGCSIMPRALTPSQLWKMNRQPAWDEGSFSVPDPVDARLADHGGDVATDPLQTPATVQ
jgi:hypothetical protein